MDSSKKSKARTDGFAYNNGLCNDIGDKYAGRRSVAVDYRSGSDTAG